MDSYHSWSFNLSIYNAGSLISVFEQLKSRFSNTWTGYQICFHLVYLMPWVFPVCHIKLAQRDEVAKKDRNNMVALIKEGPYRGDVFMKGYWNSRYRGIWKVNRSAPLGTILIHVTKSTQKSGETWHPKMKCSIKIMDDIVVRKRCVFEEKEVDINK